MVTIRQKLVTASQAVKITNGKNNAKKYIVVHETDNTNIGADADAHARLQVNGNSRQASWHWQVDDKEAVQSFEHYWECWGAGTYIGNKQGIQVEICVNSDGNYLKAVQNAASLIAKIIKDENIALQNIVQHNYFSGKNCPRNIRAGKSTLDAIY
ncbi:N-acetylmuramoyl-L-alanine amidase [Lysinibacillus agricola]|uniref:N-acetylmuramoyl-L-alanine amidase n=1 Tax=Lysinibacillus agricola TaxID=2590012 RepID=A0ABX7AXU5_9BACI|nr:N-acetylmuramoyl-L-alanine amidase [Lysinibacillus agricola]QQP14783.1 N-acetylmuramoyl-L-alanine amidase [Lysinibacillus agricola]